MGQRRRDIWSGVPHVKIFWDPRRDRGAFVANLQRFIERTASINDLTNDAQVTRDDVLAAAAADRRAVERTPLIESADRWRASLAQMRMPADRRRVQAARRDQPPAAAWRPRSGSAGVVAFSSGNHARGVAIAAQRLGIRGDHRHARRRAAGEDRGHARRGRRNRLLRPPHRKPRGDRRARSPPRRARPWSRASTIRQSSPARAPSGSRSSSSWRSRRSRPDGSSCRAAAAGWRRESRWPCPDAEIIVVEPEGWDDMAPLARAGEIVPVGAGRAADLLRRAADPASVADHLRHPAATRGAEALSVSDAEVEEAVRFAWSEHRADRRAGRRGRARGAARRQGRSGGGDGGRVVGRKYRPGASRPDRRVAD